MVGAREHGNEPSGYIKRTEFIDPLGDDEVLRKDSASRSLCPGCHREILMLAMSY
jgi:hypothetical protein